MITQEQIQAMVDGECSHEIRAALLRQMDSEPATWRTLALSLLEEQEWARQFSVMAKCDSMKSLSTDSTCDRESKQSVLPADSTSSLSQPLVALAESSGVDGASRSPAWLSVLAASLLLGLGFYGGSYLPRFGGLDSQATTGEMATVSANPTRADRSDLADKDMSETNMRMLVSGPNKEMSEIPIYDAMDHDVFVAKQALEVARLNQQLRKEGFELDVRPEYYTGKLHDGRKLIVPVKHVGLKPYGL